MKATGKKINRLLAENYKLELHMEGEKYILNIGRPIIPIDADPDFKPEEFDYAQIEDVSVDELMDKINEYVDEELS